MTKITLFRGDITQIAVDAIVNAANHTLLGGGGLDGQIHFYAGPGLLEECRTLRGCEKGQAKITKGHQLLSKYVIHTVGPVFGFEDGLEEGILRSCYISSLELAKQHGLKTIAFPTVGTGCFRFPKDKAATVAKKTVSDYVASNPEAFDEIIFVLFNDLDFNIYNALNKNESENLTVSALLSEN